MYVVTPFPNLVYALDLGKSGAVKWKYEPKPKPATQGVACCDVVNRGCVYSERKIYFNTLDGNTICLDAGSGKEIWKTELGDINKGETITMAPLVVKRKVLVGNSGGELGVRGWLTALDSATGKIAWSGVQHRVFAKHVRLIQEVAGESIPSVQDRQAVMDRAGAVLA